MKKLSLCLLALILILLCLTSCGYKQNDWFSEELLSRCLVSDLPEIEQNYLKQGSNELYVYFGEDEYSSYVNGIYEYLISKDFKHLGTRGEVSSSLSGAFTSYYLKPATDLEDFYVDGAYRFVFSDGKTADGDGSLRFSILMISSLSPSATTVEDGRDVFRYNTTVKLCYNSEYPLSGRYLLPEENEGCVHTFGEWQYDGVYHWRDAVCDLGECDIDTLSEHLDWDGDHICDVCGAVYDTTGLASVLIEHENSERERIDRLCEENPHYLYYFNKVKQVSCTLILDRDASAEALIEKHGMTELFGDASVSPLNAIKMISIIFNRDSFTEYTYSRLTEICDSEPLITNLYIDYESEWSESYMPILGYYAADPIIPLEYEEAICPTYTDSEIGFIFKTKAEYDTYLDALIFDADDYRKEHIAAQKHLYDEAFFEENALIVTKVIVRSSCSVRLTVDGLYLSGDKAYVVVRTDVPYIGDDAMQFTSFAFSVRKDDVKGINGVVTLE